MSNVISLPPQKCIVVTEGIDNETGQHLYVLEYVEREGRTFVGSYANVREASQAVADWQGDGVPVRWR